MRSAILARAAVLLAAAAPCAVARAEDPADAAQRARGVVERVFAAPEFRPLAEADRIPEVRLDADLSWLEEARKQLGDAMKFLLERFVDFLRWLTGLRRLFGDGDSAEGGGSGETFRLVGWVLAIAAAGLVVWLVVRLLLASAAERRARAAAMLGAAPAGGHEDDALAHTPGEWRRSAAELAGGGRRREAMRALYLALLSGLHHAGAIDYDRTRTNTAYAGDLGPDHAARPQFVRLTRRFDVAWYGGREPSDADLAAATSEADAVLAAFGAEGGRA